MPDLHGAALALQLARHVHQAAEIAGQQRAGAGGRDVGRSCRSTMALEISGYFTQKVPPKPQQTSGAVISRSSRPLDAGEQAARLALDPSSRRPEQES